MSSQPPPQRSPSVSSHAASSEPEPEPEREPAPESSAATGGGSEGSVSTSQTAFVGDDPEFAQKMAMMGLRVSSPARDMHAPSPPLTPLDADAHARQEHPHSEARTPESEMDISALHASWREDDLGSATSKDDDSKDVPSADDAVRMAFGGAGEPSRARQTEEHPLKLDGQPPSPPLWERINPPATNGGRDPYGSSNTRIAHDYPSVKPLRSRPLIPYSSYYFGPPPRDAAYGTPAVGQIGVHHPREIVRIERDYSGGELPQFAPIYPLEFEGRLTPTQFLETINDINEILIDAHSLQHSFLDNALAFLTFQASRLVVTSHYEKEMRRLQRLIEDRNIQLYNPKGLNILWPRKVAFLFLEIEYY